MSVKCVTKIRLDSERTAPSNELAQTVALAPFNSTSSTPAETLPVSANTPHVREVITANVPFKLSIVTGSTCFVVSDSSRRTSSSGFEKTSGDTPAIGYDTETALRAGAVVGLQHEIEGYVSSLSRTSDNLKVVLTGGDCESLHPDVAVPVYIENNLVAYGLNRVLLYNKNLA